MNTIERHRRWWPVKPISKSYSFVSFNLLRRRFFSAVSTPADRYPVLWFIISSAIRPSAPSSTSPVVIICSKRSSPSIHSLVKTFFPFSRIRSLRSSRSMQWRRSVQFPVESSIDRREKSIGSQCSDVGCAILRTESSRSGENLALESRRDVVWCL